MGTMRRSAILSRASRADGGPQKERLACNRKVEHIWIPVHQTSSCHMRVVERASKYTHVTAALRDGPLYLSQTTIPSTRSRALYLLYLPWSAASGALTRTSPFVEVDLHSESPPRGSHLAKDLAPVSSVTADADEFPTQPPTTDEFPTDEFPTHWVADEFPTQPPTARTASAYAHRS